jgi:GntR family transcriptional regulator
METPQHIQLAETLFTQISDGTLAVGDRMPTELQMSESTGLARGTVRRALDHLEGLGMISRRPGAGTVVLFPAPVERYQPVAQSAADIAAFATDTKLLSPEIGEVVIDEALANRIGTAAGETWFVIKGARAHRKGDAPPLCWSEHYIRGDLSRTALLRGVLSPDEIARTRTEQSIYADLLDPDIAAALDAAPGAAALVISRRAWDDDGRLLSVGIHTHRADRYRVTSFL